MRAETVASVLMRAATLVLISGAIWFVVQFPFDDAFIHMRLARNLAFEGSPYFNLGERVMGGSSPAWLLLLAGAFRLTGTASVGLVAAIEVAVCVALADALERFFALGRRRGIWTASAAAVVVLGLVLVSSALLMEPALALLALTWGLLALARGRAVLAGVALAVAAATRLELVAPVCALTVLAPPELRRRVAATTGGVLAALGVFQLAAYGTLVPNTMVAKARVYALTARDVMNRFPGPDLFPGSLRAVALVAFALTIAAVTWARARSAPDAAVRLRWRAASMLAAFAAALPAFYVFRRAFVFPWYWPISLVPLAMAALALALWNREAFPRSWRIASAVAIVALQLAPWLREAAEAAAHVARRRPGQAVQLSPNGRTATYQRIGALLANACPGAVVMAAEIGALGWSYPGKILDAVGLVSPEVLPYHPLAVPTQRAHGGLGAIPAQAALDLAPDAIVTMDAFGTDLERDHARILAAGYRVVAAFPLGDPSLRGLGFPDQLWGSTNVFLLARGDCAHRVAFMMRESAPRSNL